MKTLIAVLLAGVLVSCAREKEKPASLDQWWTKESKIQPQSQRQSKLTTEQLARVKSIQASLAEVDGSSLDKWLEDFEKDRNPEREIRIWEAITQSWQSYCSTHALTSAGRREVYAILLMRSGADEAEVLRRFHPKVLTAKEVRDVVGSYKGDWAPPTYETK